MKTSISKYTARKIERILNELLADDEFDSLDVSIRSSEYMGDVDERECVDITWTDYNEKGRDFVQSVIYRLLAEDEEYYDKDFIMQCSDRDEWTLWTKDGREEKEFFCARYSWLIAIEDED